MRRRRYVARRWFMLLKPAFRFSYSRDAFVLRGVGRSAGPVLRPDRRTRRERPRDGIERRSEHIV